MYEISNRGRLKSYKQHSIGKVLKQTNKKGGYFSIVLQGKGKRMRSTRIHRLVAEAFIPNPENLPEVNHIDYNKQNNNVENLEWCTRSQNAAHARKHNPNITKAMVVYNKKIRPKPLVQVTINGEIVGRYNSAAEAGRATGACARNILQVASHTPFNKKGQVRRTAGGYVWMFESEVTESGLQRIKDWKHWKLRNSGRKGRH